jgi:ComF family protein
MDGSCARCGLPYPQNVPICGACVGKRLYLDSVVSPYLYQSPLKEVIQRWKYHRSFRSWNLLRNLFLSALEAKGEVLRALSAHVVVPVPLHWRRRWVREFNQSEMLSALAGDFLSISVMEAVRRVRHTPPQRASSFQKRKENIRGAFALKEEVKGKRVLLVDDVATTLATASEMGRVLVKGGASEVHLLVLARVVR